MSLSDRFADRGTSAVVNQTVVFSVAYGLVYLIAAVSTTLLARNFTTREFGGYSFAIGLLTFVALFFEFGLFTPAARLAASSSGDERSHVIGGALVLFLPVAVLFSVTIFVSSYFVDDISRVDIGSALRFVAPFAAVYPFRLIVSVLAQGSDRLHLYSIATLVGQSLFAGGIGAAVGLGLPFDVTTALILQSGCFALAFLGLAALLRPRFTHTRSEALRLVTHARLYGVQIYIGRVFSVGTYNMDILMLGALANVPAVGFYSLAGSIAAVSGLPIQGLAGALFPRMAREGLLKRRWLTLSYAVGAVCVAVTWVLAGPLIGSVFGSRYDAAVALTFPLALAQAVRGVTTVYNNFLSAQAFGRELRNCGLVLTGANLLLNFALIPTFGATGAAWASFFALVANLVAHALAYRSVTTVRTESIAPVEAWQQ